jgi:ribosomal protein L12E/L44/L45/RPP1/RPP2
MVKIKFINRSLVRRFGAKPIEISESRAKVFLKKGEAVLIEEEISEQSEESSMSSQSSESSESSSESSSSSSEESEEEEKPEPEKKVKVNIKKKKK